MPVEAITATFKLATANLQMIWVGLGQITHEVPP